MFATTKENNDTGFPERNLAASVIAAAWQDAHGDYGVGKLDIAEARLFLTATSGKWAKSRQMWCDAAGIDPQALVERCRNLPTDEQIAAKRAAAIAKAIANPAKKPLKRNAPITPEQLAEMQRLRAEGLAYHKIGRVVGASENTVSYYCRANGFSKQMGAV